MEFWIPREWTLPPILTWYQCECGMVYGDHPDATQRDYDVYYNERYGYGVEDEGQRQRILERALFINTTLKDKSIRVVDYGGGESGLSDKLRKMCWFADTHCIGAGDTMPDDVDLVIAEHVMEHVYDMPETMAKFDKVKQGGMAIIDIPDATSIMHGEFEEMPILDFHQKHINHFRAIDIMRLMDRHGFELRQSFQYTERYLPCACYVFTKTNGAAYDHAHDVVYWNIEKKANKLRELGTLPVIIWGLGDIALHTLTKVKPNITHLVDNDPAYRGAVVHGLPVEETVTTNEPIVIIAQSQKKKLIENIRAMGIENEIIEI